MEEPQAWPTSSGDRPEKTAETLRAMRDLADQMLDTHRRQLSEIEEQLNARVQQIAEELARDQVATEQELIAGGELLQELQHHKHLLAQAESELQTVRDQLASQSAQYESQIGTQAQQLTELREQQEQDSQQRRQLDEALEHLRRQSEQDRLERERLAQELQAARDTLEQLQSQPCESCEQTREQLAAAEERYHETLQRQQTLDEQLQSLRQEYDQTQQRLQEALDNNDQAAVSLRHAEQRIVELEENSPLEEQLEQTQRKFELALADVHKLKRENTELHEELVRRPESEDQESPELVSLRAERDALATRVAELESAPAQAMDADVPQEVADLQRRFELAVDDVRQLKQENARLQEQLAQAPTVDVAEATGGPMDWQALKAKLLAELAAEDEGAVRPERREERTTIQGTIAITDRVVAQKDEEIEKLRAQLEAKPTEQPPEETTRAVQEEILDRDQLIQAERERLEALQQEWKEKLRAAELEISVQRAKLAREEALLEQKRLQLQSAEPDPEAEETSPSKPRRRWLSALGLGDDDQTP